MYLHHIGEEEDRYTKEDIVVSQFCLEYIIVIYLYALKKNPSIAVTAVNPGGSNNGKALTLITGGGGPR